MTLYEKLLQMANELDPDLSPGDRLSFGIEITSLSYGRGQVTRICVKDDDAYPIEAKFENTYAGAFTHDGKEISFHAWPQIAIGHFSNQKETVEAIEQQNFKMHNRGNEK